MAAECAQDALLLLLLLLSAPRNMRCIEEAVESHLFCPEVEERCVLALSRNHVNALQMRNKWRET